MNLWCVLGQGKPVTAMRNTGELQKSARSQHVDEFFHMRKKCADVLRVQDGNNREDLTVPPGGGQL